MKKDQLKLVQMRCPSCGNNITQFKPFNATVECPYCHEKSINPLVVEKKLEYPETMVECTKTEEDFSDYLLMNLLEGDLVPKDVFQNMGFDKLIMAYLPCYYYQGNYKCAWSCDVGYDKDVYDRETKKHKTIIEWRAKHGSFDGNFQMTCLALKDDSLPKELTDFAGQLDATNFNFIQFDESVLNNHSLANDEFLTAEKNITTEVGWSNCREFIENVALEKANNVLPSPKRNIKVSVSGKYDFSKYTFVPFWFVYYKYNNKQYFCAMDGEGIHGNVALPKGEYISKLIRKILFSWIAIGIMIIAFAFTTKMPKDMWGFIAISGLLIAPAGYFIHKKLTIRKYRKERIIEAGKVFPKSAIVQKMLSQI